MAIRANDFFYSSQSGELGLKNSNSISCHQHLAISLKSIYLIVANLANRVAAR
jgi:hypothetical protein